MSLVAHRHGSCRRGVLSRFRTQVPALLACPAIRSSICISMSDLYPLLMSPVFDPRPWGTLDLSPIYPNHRFEEKIGESWLTGDKCKVANGPLRGKSLAELSTQYGKRIDWRCR